MTDRTKSALRIILTSTAAVAVYYWVAKVLMLEYIYKSGIKLVLFLGLPILYRLLSGKAAWHNLLDRVKPGESQWPQLLKVLLVGLMIILAANLLIDPICRLFGIESVIAEIQQRTNTSRQRLWLAMIYIPLVNALAEEVFFRAFGVLGLAELGFERMALVLPAILFALYHLAIFQNWFSLPILALCLTGLFLCGLLLGHLVRRQRNIAGVWLLHGLVNIAIISISLKFFAPS